MSTTPEQSAPAEVPPTKPWKIIAATSIGNAIEWYDITIYSYFAVYISVAYFPAESHTASLMLTLATFALSFFIRPIGAIVLGGFADRRGRKPALTLTILLMFGGTLLIVVMPPAAVIGIAAPLFILLARLIQGFAAGGEFGSATALMVEHLPDKRGFAASWQFTSQAISSLLASIIGVTLTTTLSQDQLESWGFRIPFIVGLLVGPIGLYIRRRIPESPEFLAAQAAGRTGRVRADSDTRPTVSQVASVTQAAPDTQTTVSRSASVAIVEVFKRNKLAVILAIGGIAVSTCLNYFISYVPTYAVDNLGMTSSAGFVATLASAIVLMLFTPLSGFLSDRIGRLRLMIPAAVIVMIVTWFLFSWAVAANTLSVLIIVVALFSLLKATYYGPLASVMSDIFPTETRSTGMALGYNIGVAVFGGLTPLVAAWLINTTGDAKAPAYWVLLAGALSIAALIVAWKKIGVR